MRDVHIMKDVRVCQIRIRVNFLKRTASKVRQFLWDGWKHVYLSDLIPNSNLV